MLHAALRVRLFVPLFVLIVLATGSAGATGIGEPAPASDSVDLQQLTVGIMPAVDSGPLIVALSEGYFADEGLEVSLQLFRDQLYREAALQSGAIDVAVTDLVNAIRLWDNGAGSRVITATQGVFSIVAGPGSGISSSSDWPELPGRVQTGSLEDSIINYVALRMLEHLGLEPQTLTVVPVLQMPLRVEMVVADQLDAVVLPEPVTRLATAGGAREIVRSDIMTLWLALVVWAGLGVLQEWDAILGSVNDQVLSAGNLALIAATYIPVKILHELGHGWVAKRYGAYVHDTGLMFLVFMPVPYVDASSAAALPSKWQRIFVSAAGIMVETGLAAAAFLIWREIEPGLERALLFNVMLIGGISTVLVNGNPLLRFDGYFILSDLVEIPNLAQRANSWWGEHWQRRAYGAEDVVPKPATRFEAVAFLLYAPLAFAYRIFISVTIALFLVTRLFGLGVLFAAWSFFNVLLKPLGKAFWTLATGPRLRAVRGRAYAVTAGALALTAILLFAVPVPWATRTMGVVWLPETAVLRSEGQGVLTSLHVAAGAEVAPGDLIASLESDVQRAEAEVARARVEELRRRLAADSVTDRARARLTRIEYDAAQADLARAEEELGALEIRAAVAGRFEPARPAADMEGGYVRRGEEIGHVLPDRPAILRYVVTQGAVDAARTRLQGIEIRLPTEPGRSVRAEPLREVPAAAFELPSPVLGTRFGGPVPVDPQSRSASESLRRVFQFEAALPPGLPPRFGGPVHVRLDHGSRPAGRQLLDWLSRLFLRGLDV